MSFHTVKMRLAKIKVPFILECAIPSKLVGDSWITGFEDDNINKPVILTFDDLNRTLIFSDAGTETLKEYCRAKEEDSEEYIVISTEVGTQKIFILFSEAFASEF